MITKFDNFLNETNITDKVWHRTSPTALIKMLKSGKILMSTSMGTNADRLSKKPYFLSLSRTKNLKFGYGKGAYTVAIEFDGKQLKTKYSGKSLDYWAWPNLTDKRRSELDEYEDRIFSNSPFLDNLNKYVVNIDMYVKLDWDEWQKDTGKYIISTVNTIKKITDHPELLKKVRIFTDQNDFAYGKNWKSLDNFKPPEIEENEEDNKWDRYLGSFDLRLLKNILVILLVGDKNIDDKEYVRKFVQKYLDKFIDLGEEKLKNIDENEMNSMIYHIQQKVQYSAYLETDEDFHGSINADIHNLGKSSSKTTINYEILKLLSDEMIKYKVNSINDLIKAKNGYKKKKNIDYSKRFIIVYKSYDRYNVISEERNILWWFKLNNKDKNGIQDMGYPVTTKNVINYIFNFYDEEKAKEIVESILDESYILVDLNGKLVYKEITEADYSGDDIGHRGAWVYIDKSDWWFFIQNNTSEEYIKKNFDKLRKLCEDNEIKIRFIWAITEKLIGEEKTKKFFEDHNLIPRTGDRNEPEVKYLLNIGEKKEKEEYVN